MRRLPLPGSGFRVRPFVVATRRPGACGHEARRGRGRERASRAGSATPPGRSHCRLAFHQFFSWKDRRPGTVWRATSGWPRSVDLGDLRLFPAPDDRRGGALTRGWMDKSGALEIRHAFRKTVLISWAAVRVLRVFRVFLPFPAPPRNFPAISGIVPILPHESESSDSSDGS
jgi:hypothetical protein